MFVCVITLHLVEIDQITFVTAKQVVVLCFDRIEISRKSGLPIYPRQGDDTWLFFIGRQHDQVTHRERKVFIANVIAKEARMMKQFLFKLLVGQFEIVDEVLLNFRGVLIFENVI